MILHFLEMVGYSGSVYDNLHGRQHSEKEGEQMHLDRVQGLGMYRLYCLVLFNRG